MSKTIRSATFEYSKELIEMGCPLCVDMTLSIRQVVSDFDDIKKIMDMISEGTEIDIVKEENNDE